MCKIPWTTVSVLLVGVGLGAAVTAVGGPFVPRTAEMRMPDEARSLEGIRSIRLEIGEVAPDLDILGLEESEIRGMWRAQLEKVDVEITEDRKAPLMTLIVSGGVEPDAPEIIGFVFLSELEQEVQFPRLNRSLEVPTYTKFFLGIETRGRAADLAKEGMNQLIQDFCQTSRIANRKHSK
ncbi:MAG: hypothetical protein CMJ18_22365 [Phycisphaeraceae bacterium]|nr:hypothetical protein [Phycisphaeraceae bacterium]